MSVYLKTYFYVEHEFQFLAANLIESYPYIEKFIMCEFNRTHTGNPREFIGWDKLSENLPQEYLDKVHYLPVDISTLAVPAYNDEDSIHQINEPIMRSIFMRMMEFKDDDIIVSVDADEIIYGDSYPYILENVEQKNCIRLNLHQFFYKINYLWQDKDFVSPIATKYKVFKNNFPCNWRDVGSVTEEKVGCHFSWCMTPKEMVYKLHTYSHPMYRFCADIELMESSVENKEYPVDRSVDFRIKELEMSDPIIPRSIRGENDK